MGDLFSFSTLLPAHRERCSPPPGNRGGSELGLGNSGLAGICALKPDLQAFSKKPLCPVHPAPLPHRALYFQAGLRLCSFCSAASGFPEPGQEIHRQGEGGRRKVEDLETCIF